MCSHEKPDENADALNKQNIKDRFNGKNDPVAMKILERQRLQQEEDKREKMKVKSVLFGSHEGISRILGE